MFRRFLKYCISLVEDDLRYLARNEASKLLIDTKLIDIQDLITTQNVPKVLMEGARLEDSNGEIKYLDPIFDFEKPVMNIPPENKGKWKYIDPHTEEIAKKGLEAVKNKANK
jgi:hypothetical protein